MTLIVCRFCFSRPDVGVGARSEYHSAYDTEHCVHIRVLCLLDLLDHLDIVDVINHQGWIEQCGFSVFCVYTINVINYQATRSTGEHYASKLPGEERNSYLACVSNSG